MELSPASLGWSPACVDGVGGQRDAGKERREGNPCPRRAGREEEHEGGKQEVGTEKGASTRVWPEEDGHCCLPLNLLRSRLPDAKLEAPGEGLGLGFL